MLRGAALLPSTSVPAQWLSSADSHGAVVPFRRTALSPGLWRPWEGLWEGPGSLQSFPSLRLAALGLAGFGGS